MHQDAFSAKYCGEGVPDWAVYAGSELLSHRYWPERTHVVECCGRGSCYGIEETSVVTKHTGSKQGQLLTDEDPHG